MKRLLIVLLLAGCAQQEIPVEPAPPVPAQVEQPAKLTCEPFTTNTPQLKRMTKSRDEWKRYAESLEKLLPADKTHGTHP